MASTSLVETRNILQQFTKSEHFYDGNQAYQKIGMTTANPLPPTQLSPPLNQTTGVTSLMQACQQGKDVAVRQLLHKDPNTVQYRDRTGKTALHYCAENNSLNCIEQLLNADPSLLLARDEDGYTALHLATIAGNKAVVKYLLSKGADIHALDNEDHSTVHWATVGGEVELLDLLIESGADPSRPDIHGAYPIHYAAQMCGPNSELGTEVHVGRLVLQKLLQRGVDVSVRDHDGRQPLLWAASAEVRPSHKYCISGSADAIMALINAGADVAAEDKDGLTALHCAASRGHVDCIDVLIYFCNADVDTMDSNGCTPLFYAVTLGHADCTEQLLKHGAVADRQDRKGRTPAHCGAAKGQLETLKLLHRRGADMWKKNIKGDLPLHEACQSGRRELVLWLLSLRPEEVNAPNNDGRCPLHIAAINGSPEMCKVLLDAGATLNPIMRNSRGQLLTPVDAAVARGNKEVAKYLHLHGGLPASKLTDKKALQLAMQKALEAGPVIGRTGATPLEFTPEETTESSSPNQTKTPSTTLLTPTKLLPNNALTAETGTSIHTQASVGLQMGSSSFSPHSVDSQSQTEASPQLHDAGTYTSEENIRELVLQEERILLEKRLLQAERLMLEERLLQEKLKAEEKQGSTQSEVAHQELSENTLAKDKVVDNSTSEKDVDETAAENDGTTTNADRVDNGNIENTEEEITTNASIENTNKEIANNDENDENSEQTAEEKEENSKNENDSESLESRATESSSESSQATVKSIKSNSKSEKSTKTKTIATVSKQDDNVSIEAEENTEAKNQVEAEEDQSTKSESISKESKATAVSGESKSQKNVAARTKVKGQNSKEKTVKKGVSSEADSEKSNSKTNKKAVNKSKQGNPTKESEKEKKVTRQNTKKSFEDKNNTKENVSKAMANNGNTKKRTKSEDPSGRNPKKKDEERIRSKSLEKSVAKEKNPKPKKTSKSETDIILVSQKTEKKASSQKDDSAEESGTSEGSDSESGASSKESKLPTEKAPSNKPKKMKDKLSVTERELGDGASEDGEGVGLSDAESASKSSKSKSSSKKKNSKPKKSNPVEESDADQSANESSSSSSSSPDKEKKADKKDDVNQKSTKRPSRPRTAVKHNPKLLTKDRLIVAETDSLYSNDERTHEMLLMTSGRETGLVREAPSHSVYSPSRLSLQDQQNLKIQKDVNDTGFASQSEGRDSSSSSSADEENEPKHSNPKEKRKTKKPKTKLSDGNESIKTIVENGVVVHSDANRNPNEPRRKHGLNRSERVPKRLPGESYGNEGENDEMSRSESDEDMDANDPARKRMAREKRRKMKTTKELAKTRDRKEVGKRVLSGGPKKVQTMDRSLKRKTSPATEMSITRAMQSTLRKYSLERRLFQQLLDLKRIQIRNSRANEHVMIKRLVEEYNKEGNLLGLKDYVGPYNFQSYEKYLYDQLRTLQTSQGTKIPRFKPNDDVEKLTRALRRANVPDFTQTLEDKDRNAQNCNHTTHRCHHAIHAYTGVPCAAYLAQYNRNVKAGKVNLPKIPPPGPVRGDVSNQRTDMRPYDPRKPLKVELQHGSAKQQISLPTNFLDKSQKYQLTVNIQPTYRGNKREELNITTETENLAKAQSESKPSSAHSAPDASVASTTGYTKEPRSSSIDGERPPFK